MSKALGIWLGQVLVNSYRFPTDISLVDYATSYYYVINASHKNSIMFKYYKKLKYVKNSTALICKVVST